MKRKFTLLLTVLFTLFTLPVNGLTVLAAEDGSYDDIENGTHDITAKAMHADKDEASGAAGFIDEDAELVIEDDLIQLIITVPNNEMAEIKGIQVEGKEAEVSDLDDAKVYTFTLDTLKEELHSQVQYEVPSLNMEHDVSFRFILEGLDELPVKEEPVIEVKTETKEVPVDFETVVEEDSSLEKDVEKVKQEGKEGTKEITYEVTYTDGEETDRRVKNESITKEPKDEIVLIGTKEEKPQAGTGYNNIEDGEYDITAKAMHDEKDEPSGAASFINEDAILTITDSIVEITIGVPNGDMATIDGIQIEDKEGKVEEKDDITYYTFALDELKKELHSQVQYSVPAIGLEHDVPFRFILEGLDELPVKDDNSNSDVEVKNETKTETIKYETVEKKDSSLEKGKTKIKQKGVNGSKEVTYEVTYTDGKETERKVKKESVTKEPVNEIILVGTKTKTKTETIEDGTYDIIAKAMHATKDEPSGAAQFINEDAQIVIKDGVIQLVITVPHNDMAVISGMQVEGKEASIEDTKEGKVYTFTLDTLKEVLNSQVQYQVPSLGMDHDVEFRFVLEGLDKLPIKVEKQNNEPAKDPKKEAKEDPSDTPKKPTFGSNDGDGQKVATSTKDDHKNPQTGDTSAIMFYALLLIGSLIPLAVKFKRRFA